MTARKHEPASRGGYTSSSKPASQLRPPPPGPAPGARRPVDGDGRRPAR